ncbi:MAG: Stk1 family PASTA domain-containing Ser/Thr kinase [Erysipelothrix sp.]|nr:Stk1 family PASTA domain-containing Ser/Thr kinase [Erysipelothrix sp.]
MNKGIIVAKRYEIVKLIGQGGMADVYLAYDILLERNVAIKILRNELSNDAISLLRFKHEAVAVSKLNHPNIIEIYDIGEFDSRQYIVMEYVDGQTLKDLIVQRGGLYIEEAIYIMKQLISAVVEAHKSNIIHRDIKPQNILVKADGTVIITDFGIALAQNALHLTQKEMVMGSVHYLAPELARGETATYQSDIYALGIVFYELLTGRVPHRGETAIQIAMQHINEALPSIREENSLIPQAVENNIIKATFKDQKQRFSSAQDMLDDLQSVLLLSRSNEAMLKEHVENIEHAETKVINSIDVLNTKTKQRQNKKKILIGAMAAIVLMIVVVLVWPKKAVIVQKAVPDIVNLEFEAAKELLESQGFVVGITDKSLDDEIEKDHIIKQTPKAREMADEGSSIDITISSGKYLVFSNYVGRNIVEVRDELANTNLRILVEYVSDNSKDVNTIISQSIPMNQKLDPNVSSEVKFIVIKAPEFKIPDGIYGMEMNSAKSLLEELGAVVKLEAITDGNGKLVAGDQINVVEYSTPGRNQFYVQNEDNFITLYFYSVQKETPPDVEPEPEDPGDTTYTSNGRIFT